MADETYPSNPEILKWFEKINQIPRCSGHEAALRNWLINWAQEHHFNSKVDKIGNLLINVPASPGYEMAPSVVIQGHLDMVCEKTPDSPHNFTQDPIQFIYEGEWLRADQTTLGADNGIAIAIAMAIALDKKNSHPPLELLFTIEEETGLFGAAALEPDFVNGRTLINIDSEEEGILMMGCAGGLTTHILIPLIRTEVPSHYQLLKIRAGGMKGGHSGVEIHKEKANAIKVLARTLRMLTQQVEIRLADIKGGTAHNAIPRDSEALIFISQNQVELLQPLVEKAEAIFKAEHKNTDPNLFIQIETCETTLTNASTFKNTQQVIDILLALPYGIAAMSTEIAGIVETSNNLAQINSEDDQLNIITSQRSSVESRLDAITQRIEALVRLSGGQFYRNTHYPAWQPNLESPLLAKTIDVYHQLFGKKPIVKVIHAGLETGIIGQKIPNMDMISFGPTIKNAHSPDERIHLGTIGKIWDLTIALLKELK
jgi:dipeptidase D